LYAKRKDLNLHEVKNKVDKNSLNNEGEKDEKNTAQQLSKSANLLKTDEDVRVNIEIKSFDNEYHKINEELEKQNDHEQFNSMHDFSEINRPYTNEAKNSELFLT
jgi:hypothetical protein